MKRCNGCGDKKSLNDFSRNREGAQGRSGLCKDCVRIRRLANAVRENELKRARRKRKPEKRHYDPVKQRERNAANRSKNRDKCHALTRDWKRRNPDSVRHHNAQRRAREASAEGKFTLAEWRAKCDEYGNRCAYCRRSIKLTRHHVVPLSKGGSNWISNIVPACGDCNSGIGTKTIRPNTEVLMSFEKRGVLDSENQEPAPEKQAEAKKGCCGGRPNCGRDPMSKLAEAAAQPKQTEESAK